MARFLYITLDKGLNKDLKKDLKNVIDKIRGKGAPQARIRGYLFILFLKKSFNYS
jgi:hypothetical protein